MTDRNRRHTVVEHSYNTHITLIHIACAKRYPKEDISYGCTSASI
jgi:hypothetical protein